jgi:hypothetical protein
MSITFDLPAAVEQQLRRDVTNLDVLAKESALVELYRQGTISHHQLGLSLGMPRFETGDRLKRRHVTTPILGVEGHADQDGPSPGWPSFARPSAANGFSGGFC